MISTGIFGDFLNIPPPHKNNIIIFHKINSLEVFLHSLCLCYYTIERNSLIFQMLG